MWMKSEPLELFSAAFMPLVFGTVFIYVFGGAISGNGLDYKQFVLPGLTFQTVAVVARLTGVWLNLDFANGMMERFRSLPIARSSVLAGRIAADLCRMVVALAVMYAFAFAIGLRVPGGVAAVFGAVLLMLAFGAALACASAFLGLALRAPQTVQTVGSVWMIPLQFGSSMFVPTSTMPDWLRAVAEANPVTLVCDACRALIQGVDATSPVLGTLAWTAALIAVFGWLSVRQYARRC